MNTYIFRHTTGIVYLIRQIHILFIVFCSVVESI